MGDLETVQAIFEATIEWLFAICLAVTFAGAMAILHKETKQ